MSLSGDELRRYSRHLIMPEVGIEGQMRLKRARVAVVGAGGLGSPVALYLAAAGVGRIGIIEYDRVEESNLQRQVLFGSADVGHSKAAAAVAALNSINAHVDAVPIAAMLSRSNAREILADYDIVVDASDNFPTRYLVNDACVMLGKPDVYGSIFRFEGQVSVFAAGRGPCYRCLYPEPPPPGSVPSCAEGGVLGVLPGIIGTLQASEVLRLILGVGEPLIGRLSMFDALGATMRTVRVERDPACAVCGDDAPPVKLVDYDAFCGLPERSVYDEAVLQNVPEISVRDLAVALEADRPPVLLDVRMPAERTLPAPRARRMPLEAIAEHVGELDPAQRIVCLCQTGVRSALAARALRDAGFSDVASLRGGLLAWNLEAGAERSASRD